MKGSLYLFLALFLFSMLGPVGAEVYTPARPQYDYFSDPSYRPYDQYGRPNYPGGYDNRSHHNGPYYNDGYQQHGYYRHGGPYDRYR